MANIIMQLACADDAYYMPADRQLEDKRRFVENVGILASQTREQIKGCTLEDNDTAVIWYENDECIKVNIAMDSYTAIVKDIFRAIPL